MHHSLQVLLLQLLDALRFGLAVLLQAANFVHILIVQKPQVRCLMVQLPDLGLELWNGTRTGKSHHAKSEEHQDYGRREGQRPVPLVTRSLSSFPRRTSWWSSLFSLTSRACSALYGSRTESRFRLSPSALPADSSALRRLSVVRTRSLRETRHHVTRGAQPGRR